MLEGPEVEPHHRHTGHSRIDLIFGCLAVVLSGVSVFIAIEHGRTMERLVAANTWPNLSYGTSNENDAGTLEQIIFELKNTGVGPARIDTMELFYKGKPMASPKDLLLACCGRGMYNFATSTVIHEVLPAREKIDFISLRKDSNRPETWTTLNAERFSVRIRACYCSVFDECWVEDSATPRPSRVAQCTPSQAVQFTE
jgi:hypothetical protein